MAEDSTVVTIKGDYDQMDPVHFTGDAYFRNIVSNTVHALFYTTLVWNPFRLLDSRALIFPWSFLYLYPYPINDNLMSWIVCLTVARQAELREQSSSAVNLNYRDNFKAIQVQDVHVRTCITIEVDYIGLNCKLCTLGTKVFSVKRKITPDILYEYLVRTRSYTYRQKSGNIRVWKSSQALHGSSLKVTLLNFCFIKSFFKVIETCYCSWILMNKYVIILVILVYNQCNIDENFRLQ